MMIKVLLIASIVVGAMWLLKGQRRAGRLALTRLAGLSLAASWIVAVAWPDVVTQLANAIGVGRGTDLLLYTTVVAFMFSTVLNQRRFAEVDAQIATLARALALQPHGLTLVARERDGAA